MSGRSGIFKFLVFLLLAVMIVIQLLSMKQSDRLYERLNDVLRAVSGRRIAATDGSGVNRGQIDQGERKYIGDEGDWLVWCLSSEPATLNGVLEDASWATRWIVTGNIFESMIEYKPDAFEYRGNLAEEFSISDDGLEIYFKLKKDIRFSDGVPITTDDVIFSYETITDPNIDCPSYANYFRDVDRYEKVNDLEIKFYMKKVYFLSLGFLGGIPIYPKHVYEYEDAKEFNNRRTDPVGSGPYVFESWDVGQQVVLNRNENYWDEKPKLKKIVYKFINNETAALKALESGDIDYLRPLPDQFTDKGKDEGFVEKFHCLSYWSAGNTGYFWMGWNQARPFFADRRVRLAMTHLVDREAILKYVLRNPEAKIATGPFYIYGLQNDATIEPWPYDPEKAKKLLDEAGWVDSDGDGIRDKNGVNFSFRYMIVAGSSFHVQLAKVLKDSMSRVGIEVIPDPYEWSVFTQRVQDRKYDAVNMAWGGNVEGDPYQIWHSSQIAKGSNYVGFNNPEADRLIEQARQTLDRDKRNALYHKFHRILHEEQPYTFVYTRPEQRFLDKRFKNVQIHKLGIDEHEWYVPLAQQKYK